MYSAADVGQLVEHPLKRYLVCSSCVVWAQRNTRIGVIHNAPKLDAADFPILAQCLGVATHEALAAKYDIFLDMSCVAGVDHTAFEFITRWLESSFPLFEHRVRRVAGIAPDGVVGAALTGILYKWAASRFEARICSTRDELYEVLEIDASDAAELDMIYTMHGPGPLRQFRDVLAANITDKPAQLATRVGVTDRSLRRLLSQHGTTLRREVTLARLRVAMARLASTRTSVTLIAKALGYRSTEAFDAEFEAATGVSTSAYRANAAARSSRRSEGA